VASDSREVHMARPRGQTSLAGLVLGVAVAIGGLRLAARLGVPPLALLLLALVVLAVTASLWGYDSRDGRDWPPPESFQSWLRRRSDRYEPPVSPTPWRWPGGEWPPSNPGTGPG
jgi:hypothetical protein